MGDSLGFGDPPPPPPVRPPLKLPPRAPLKLLLRRRTGSSGPLDRRGMGS